MPKKPWSRDKGLLPSKAGPTKLTQAMADSVVKYLSGYAFREDAAALAGISPGTLRNWIRWGARDIEQGADTKEARLCAAVRAAEANCRGNIIRSILGLSTKAGDYRGIEAAGRMRFPEQFQEQKKINIEIEKNVERLLDAVRDVADKLKHPELYEAVLERLTEGLDADE